MRERFTLSDGSEAEWTEEERKLFERGVALGRQGAILKVIRICREVRIPFEDSLKGETRREKFYQTHIRAAWRQCTLRIENEIRKQFLFGESD